MKTIDRISHATHAAAVSSFVLLAMLHTGTPTITLNSAAPPPAVSVIDAQRRTLTAGFDCTPESKPRLVDRVVILDEDTTVVTAVTFDRALALTKSGHHRVLAYCD